MRGFSERLGQGGFSSVGVRICAGALALLVLGAPGCRPRWSQDGKRLVFTALEGKRQVFAVHDLESGKSRKLGAIEPNDGAADLVWDRDGSQWVVASAEGSEDHIVRVYTLDWDGKEGESHLVNVGTRNVISTLHEPVVCGGKVFLTGSSIIRLDLATGEVSRGEADRSSVFPWNAGVGYVRDATGDWEIGALDPETMAAKPWFQRPDDCDWQIVPHPRFDPAGDRCAVVGLRGEPTMALDTLEWAILILEEGRLISTIELGGDMAAGPVAWVDAVTVCATVKRPGDDHDTLSLVETDFSGAVRHETPILRVPTNDRMIKNFGIQYVLKLPFFMEPSPSPDGSVIAFTTAKLPPLPDELSGLLLLRRRESRRVDRLPFEFEAK
jgi:dipeptidyl aminopeptidase/acylaminoacyl peptidase